MTRTVEKTFRKSLHDSRLFLNAHVRVLQVRELKVINAEYMRPIRKIEDMCRFDSWSVSDYTVRCNGGYPSADCVILRARLRYLRRLLCSSCMPLKVLPSIKDKNGEPALQWPRLIMNDLKFLRSNTHWIAKMLPPPEDDADSWAAFIMNEESFWHEAIDGIHFVDSVCDNTQTERGCTTDIPPVITLPCMTCQALLLHMRSKHGERTPMRYCGTTLGLTCSARHLKQCTARAHVCWRTSPTLDVPSASIGA